jgi:hypothetical protein
VIPKTLFLYWGGQPLSWLRYQTIKSFKKHNPDWKVRVFGPVEATKGGEWATEEQRHTYEGKDYMPKFETFDPSLVGFTNVISEVYKSDLFRLWALYEYGGAYADFDILFTKPMPKLTKFTYCKHPYGHYSIGLIAAEKDNLYIKKLLKAARSAQGGKYQSFGSTLWGHTLTDVEGWNIPKDLIYFTDWRDADKLFTQVDKLPKQAIGVHWYGGSPEAGVWESELTPKNYKQYPSTITEIIREI